MKVIRLTKYAMLRRLLWSVVLVILCIIPALVFARDSPPKALMEHISSHKLVYAKKCNVEFLKLKHVECLIFHDEAKDRVWLVLFDNKLNITHVAVNNKGKEELVWCNERTCV